MLFVLWFIDFNYPTEIQGFAISDNSFPSTFLKGKQVSKIPVYFSRNES